MRAHDLDLRLRSDPVPRRHRDARGARPPHPRDLQEVEVTIRVLDRGQRHRAGERVGVERDAGSTRPGFRLDRPAGRVRGGELSDVVDLDLEEVLPDDGGVAHGLVLQQREVHLRGLNFPALVGRTAKRDAARNSKSENERRIVLKLALKKQIIRKDLIYRSVSSWRKMKEISQF